MADSAWVTWENARKRTVLNLDSIQIEQTAIQLERLLRPFPFISLPRQLRDIIYGYCMTRRKVYIHAQPYLDSHVGRSGTHLNPRYRDLHNVARPEGQLLGTSHQLGVEAARVLFQTNELIFGHKDIVDMNSHFFRTSQHLYWSRAETCLRYLAQQHVRSLSIALDMRTLHEVTQKDTIDTAIMFRKVVSDIGVPTVAPTWDSLPTVSQHLRAHRWAHGNTHLWGLVCDGTDGIGALIDYRRLVVDFTLSYCGLGCCRYLSQAFTALIRGLKGWSVPGHQPAYLEIHGKQTRLERNLSREKLFDLLRDTAPGHRGLQAVRFQAIDNGYKSFGHRALHNAGMDSTLGDEDVDLHDCVNTVDGLFAMSL